MFGVVSYHSSPVQNASLCRPLRLCFFQTILDDAVVATSVRDKKRASPIQFKRAG